MALSKTRMSDGMKDELERQVARLLEEAEKPMRVEEIIPHLDPIRPSPNDVAEVLTDLAQKRDVTRDGSFFRKPTPVPVDALFHVPAHKKAADVVLAIIRELDEANDEDGARFPEVLKVATDRGVPSDLVLDVVTVLRNAGEIYSVSGDKIRLAKS